MQACEHSITTKAKCTGLGLFCSFKLHQLHSRAGLAGEGMHRYMRHSAPCLGLPACAVWGEDRGNTGTLGALGATLRTWTVFCKRDKGSPKELALGRAQQGERASAGVPLALPSQISDGSSELALVWLQH